MEGTASVGRAAGTASGVAADDAPRPRRPRIGLVWWLTIGFSAAAIATAVAIAQIFSGQADRALTGRAAELAAGGAFNAAVALSGAERRGQLAAAAQAEAARRDLALFVYDRRARLLTRAVSNGVELGAVGQRREAVATALGGERYVASLDPETTLLALPLAGRRARALVVVARRPDIGAGIGIARDQIVRAALLAAGVGVLAGVAAALLITTRVRRIGGVARSIAQGDFGTPLVSRFPDELGDLAASVDDMRRQLAALFAQLELERDRVAALLERLQDGVLTVDRSLRVELVNEPARRLLGAAAGEGRTLPEPWPGFALRELAAALFADGAGPTVDFCDVRPDLVLEVCGVPPAGDAETAVLVIRDVSERERRERAEREFVTNAAHELRTPLATISGAVEVLEAGAKDLPEARDHFLRHIARESARLTRLARALLVLARAQTRQEPVRVQPVALHALLQDVAEGLRPPAGVELELECDAALVVRTDRDLLEQAVANLAANAARHTSSGRITLAAAAAPGGAYVEVRDTGPGIEDAEQERIFDNFYRAGARDDAGFGLGLAIVRQVADVLGAGVEVESEPGRGSTFRLAIPAAEEEEEA